MVGSLKPALSLWKSFSAAVALWGLLEFAPGVAEAAAIRNSAKLDRSGGQTWSAFVLAKPAYWRTHQAPAFTPAVRARIWRMLRSSDPTAHPIINYLLWRRSLRPGRFDYFPPRLGPTLARLLDQPVTVTAPQNLIPSPTTPVPSPSVPQTVDPNVPEPSTVFVALIMGIWGLWSRKRLRLAQLRA